MLENLTATAPPNEVPTASTSIENNQPPPDQTAQIAPPDQTAQIAQPDQTASTGGRHKLKRKNTLHKRYNSKSSLKRRHKTNKNK